MLFYVVSPTLHSIVILTDKLIPDPDSIPDIFISEDDSVDECHDSGSINVKFWLAYIPDPDSIPDIFISKDDSLDECHESGSINVKFWLVYNCYTYR